MSEREREKNLCSMYTCVRRSNSQNKNNNKKKKSTYFLFCARVGAAYIFYNVTEQEARGTLSALIHGERGTARGAAAAAHIQSTRAERHAPFYRYIKDSKNLD